MVLQAIFSLVTAPTFVLSVAG